MDRPVRILRDEKDCWPGRAPHRDREACRQMAAETLGRYED